MQQDNFIGCFLGLAFGDAICAPYEGGPVERCLWSIIGKTKAKEMRFTDDTQMSLDIAKSFISEDKINQKAIAQEFANSYQWSRGYGPSAGKILKKIKHGVPWQEASISIYKDGSFGNGAAMRAPILALCFDPSDEAFTQNVIKSSEITHANPLAIEGALLIAHSTSYALNGISNDDICEHLIDMAEINTFKTKLTACKNHLRKTKELSVRDTRKLFGNQITAEQSCVTSIYLSLLFRNKEFISLLDFIKKLGGDTDTIAAMSGAIWGAFNGAEKLQKHVLPKIEKQNEIQNIAIKLHEIYAGKQSKRTLREIKIQPV